MVALYFAVAEAKEDGTPRVWMLDPYGLNQKMYGHPYLHIPDHSSDFANKWLPENVERHQPKSFEHEGTQYNNSKPIAVYPPHTNARIIAQDGAFTIHGADTRPLEYHCNGCTNLLESIDIEQTAVDQMKKDLDHLDPRVFPCFPIPII